MIFKYGSAECTLISYMYQLNDRVNHLRGTESNKYFIDNKFAQMGPLTEPSLVRTRNFDQIHYGERRSKAPMIFCIGAYWQHLLCKQMFNISSKTRAYIYLAEIAQIPSITQYQFSDLHLMCRVTNRSSIE